MENGAILRTFIEAQRVEDLHLQRSLLDDELVMHGPESSVKILRTDRSRQGADAYIASRRISLPKLYRPGSREIDVKCLICEGDFGAAFFRMSADLTRGGRYENDYAFLYRFHGGKIAEIWEYPDTANGLLQLGFTISA